MEIKKIDVSITTSTIFKILGILLLAYVMYLVGDILFLLFISLILASAVDPWVDWLQSKKIPRALGILIIYLGFFMVIGFAIYSIAPPIAKEVGEFSNNLPAYQEKLNKSFSTVKEFSIKHGFFKNIESALGGLNNNLQNAAGSVISTIINIFGGLFSFVLVLFLTFYMTVEENAIKRLVWILTPIKNQEYVLLLVNRMQKKIGLWLRGQLILCLCIFALAYPGLLILGVKYALVLALIAGITEAIPYIGPTLGAVPAVFLAFTQSPVLALFVGIYYYIIQMIENNILVPKIMEKAVGLNPIISIVAFLAGYNLGGIPGAILSIPVATAISVFIGDVFDNRKKGQLEPEFK